MMSILTDTELLDWLDRQTGTYTGKVKFRWSTTARGWRLHETESEGAVSTVREAIVNAMNEAQKTKKNV